MDIAVTNYELAHKSNPPQYWVFIWSLPTAAYSPEKRKDFATCIYASIKKSWHDAKAFIKVQVADSSKPVLEVRGMIWTSGDKEPPFDKESPFDKAGALPHPTIEDLQNRIRRQAQRAMLEIVDKEVLTGLKLNLLSDKVAAGSWAYNSLDRTIPLSSFVGNLEFVYLITVSIFDRVIIRGLFLKPDGIQSELQ
jgi:hypothetical protein